MIDRVVESSVHAYNTQMQDFYQCQNLTYYVYDFRLDEKAITFFLIVATKGKILL